ncbi:hypothetical protein [Streptomyces pacificus]|uniref:Uncharacterized protein n=1 Tax=Streptomyces pacificus TaxID=2705029 RepID=A0A6A0AW65_9ACTN|nr:hypothetical protein [Streptomyces pacificus]GFH37146.1 hypothetical protein SCWH03_33800 [Streptomyces pacificus]
MGLAEVLAPLRQPRIRPLGTPAPRAAALGFGAGALRAGLVARRHIAGRPVRTPDGLPGLPLLPGAGPCAGAWPGTVPTPPAAYGRWTWTHGGGPGSGVLPALRTAHAGCTRLLAAGGVGTVRPAPVPDRATGHVTVTGPQRRQQAHAVDAVGEPHAERRHSAAFGVPLRARSGDVPVREFR